MAFKVSKNCAHLWIRFSSFIDKQGNAAHSKVQNCFSRVSKSWHQTDLGSEMVALIDVQHTNHSVWRWCWAAGWNGNCVQGKHLHKLDETFNIRRTAWVIYSNHMLHTYVLAWHPLYFSAFDALYIYCTANEAKYFNCSFENNKTKFWFWWLPQEKNQVGWNFKEMWKHLKDNCDNYFTAKGREAGRCLQILCVDEKPT